MAVGLKIINGDFNIKEDGTLDLISGTAKCARDFAKMLVTEVVDTTIDSANTRYNPNYGTNLNVKSLLRDLSTSAKIDVLNTSLRSSVDYYIKLQEQRSNLSLGEVITNIDYYTYVDPTNKQRIIINFKITNGTGTTFSLDKYF